MNEQFHVGGSPNFCHLVDFTDFAKTWKCGLRRECLLALMHFTESIA